MAIGITVIKHNQGADVHLQNASDKRSCVAAAAAAADGAAGTTEGAKVVVSGGGSAVDVSLVTLRKDICRTERVCTCVCVWAQEET